MARKLKKDTDPQDEQLSNMTLEEKWEKHFPTIRAAKIELDAKQDEAKKANSVYRGLLKAAKKEGLNVDMLCEALRIQKRDPTEVDKDFRDLNAYLMLMGVPVGTQLGLFDGKSIATAVEDEKLKASGLERRTDKGMVAIEADGYDAGTSGKNANANPYEDGAPEFLRWHKGWNDGQAKLAEGLGETPAHAAE